MVVDVVADRVAGVLVSVVLVVPDCCDVVVPSVSLPAPPPHAASERASTAVAPARATAHLSATFEPMSRSLTCPPQYREAGHSGLIHLASMGNSR
jgi:hypothetical protein